MQELPPTHHIEPIVYKRTRPATRRKGSSSSKVAPKKSKKPSRSILVSKLDAVVSTYVRTFYADEQGNVSCYTCPKIAPIKSMQNGHYVSRSVRSLRWVLDNLRPQCYGCNVMHGGQPITFRENLIKELGEHEVLLLEAKRHELFSPTDEWLQDKINVYTLLVLNLRKNVL